MKHYCSLCDCEIETPHSGNANYVTGSDFCRTEPMDVHYGVFHNSETRELVDELHEKIPHRNKDELSAEMASSNAPETIKISVGMKTVETHGGRTETADIREVPFKIPRSKFYVYEIDSPNAVQSDENLALVESRQEEREIQCTGLVCRSCTSDVSECCIIWGPDKGDPDLDHNTDGSE